MNRDVDRVDKVVFSVFAEEHDMKAAEDAVLGDWSNHRSSLDWFPLDDDDHKPDPCDREISIVLDGSERSAAALVDVFKVLGHLGPKGRFWLHVSAPAFHGLFSSNGAHEATVHDRIVSDALNARIQKAVGFLEGKQE